MTSEERIREIVHEEIVKYHYYGIRHALVLTANDLTQQVKQLMFSGGNPVMLETTKKALRNIKHELKEIEKQIEKVGVFDTKV